MELTYYHGMVFISIGFIIGAFSKFANLGGAIFIMGLLMLIINRPKLDGILRGKSAKKFLKETGLGKKLKENV